MSRSYPISTQVSLSTWSPRIPLQEERRDCNLSYTRLDFGFIILGHFQIFIYFYFKTIILSYVAKIQMITYYSISSLSSPVGNNFYQILVSFFLIQKEKIIVSFTKFLVSIFSYTEVTSLLWYDIRAQWGFFQLFIMQILPYHNIKHIFIPSMFV